MLVCATYLSNANFGLYEELSRIGRVASDPVFFCPNTSEYTPQRDEIHLEIRLQLGSEQSRAHVMEWQICTPTITGRRNWWFTIVHKQLSKYISSHLMLVFTIPGVHAWLLVEHTLLLYVK